MTNGKTTPFYEDAGISEREAKERLSEEAREKLEETHEREVELSAEKERARQEKALEKRQAVRKATEKDRKESLREKHLKEREEKEFKKQVKLEESTSRERARRHFKGLKAPSAAKLGAAVRGRPPTRPRVEVEEGGPKVALRKVKGGGYKLVPVKPREEPLGLFDAPGSGYGDLGVDEYGDLDVTGSSGLPSFYLQRPRQKGRPGPVTPKIFTERQNRSKIPLPFPISVGRPRTSMPKVDVFSRGRGRPAKQPSMMNILSGGGRLRGGSLDVLGLGKKRGRKAMGLLRIL